MRIPTITMDAIFSCLAISLSLVAVFIARILFRNPRNRNQPPGPRSLPIIGHLHLLWKPLHRSLAALSLRHGPILFLRFGTRRVLVVSSPAIAEECFTRHDVNFANRPRLLANEILGYGSTTLASASYGPHWRNLRRIATIEVLSAHRITAFAEVRAGEVRAMARRLFRDGSETGFVRVEMKSRLWGLSLNVIMMMVAGKRYYGENVWDSDEARSFNESTTKSVELLGASNLHDFLPVLKWLDFHGLKKKLMRLANIRDEIMQGLIDQHRAAAEKKTLIGVLLLLQESEPEYYTDWNIKALIMNLLSAGTNTSSDTLEWALSLLLNNPTALKKAQAEMDTVVTTKGRFLQESDLPDLPYLNSVITETLRVYPVAPLLVPHESSEDCVVGGYDVPRGTMLLVNARAIHSDPEVWEDPDKFMPERFLLKGGGNQTMLPFGMGRRRCPGEGLAMKVVGLGLGTLLQCFEWERVGVEKVDMSERSGITTPKAVPLEAMCRARESMIGLLSQL